MSYVISIKENDEKKIYKTEVIGEINYALDGSLKSLLGLNPRFAGSS